MAPGTVVADRYEVRRLLGEGGMGQVYEAVHKLTRRPVALKILRPEFAQDGELVARFLREAQAAAAVGDSHVVDVFDMGRVAERGAFYLALELLSGQSLTDLIAREAPLPVARVVHIGQQIASVIGKAHRCSPRIVHRDLKPDNVFLIERDGANDFVKVLDFGIAKLLGDRSLDGPAPMSLTHTSQVLGTPLYMPPEQLKDSRSIDERADVYSIGVILYEMLTARVPVAGASLAEQFYLLMSEPIAPLKSLRADVDDALASLVERCLSRDPDQRPRDATALAESLAALARRAPTTAVEPDAMAMAMASTLHATLSNGPTEPRNITVAPPRPSGTTVAPPSRKTVVVAIAASLLVTVAVIRRTLVATPTHAPTSTLPALDLPDARALESSTSDAAVPIVAPASAPDAALAVSQPTPTGPSPAARASRRAPSRADAGPAPRAFANEQ